MHINSGCLKTALLLCMLRGRITLTVCSELLPYLYGHCGDIGSTPLGVVVSAECTGNIACRSDGSRILISSCLFDDAHDSVSHEN